MRIIRKYDENSTNKYVYMILTKYFVTGYKNLKECEVRPKGFHVITGCNGTGKSNFLETLSFIKLLINGSEDDRSRVFSGTGIDDTQWTPMSSEVDAAPAFQLEGEIELDDVTWEFNYFLKLTKPVMSDPFTLSTPIYIKSEILKAKEKGKPGAMKSILARDKEGKCIAKPEIEARKVEKFNVTGEMSALAALKIREAADFETRYPLTKEFLKGISDARVISLNPKALLANNRSYESRIRQALLPANQNTISSVNLYEKLTLIQSDEFQWEQLCYWAKEILRISKIQLREKILELEDGEEVVNKSLLLTQDDKVLWPYELSNGSVIILALLCLLLQKKSNASIMLIEEPEAYIHPKAIVDIVTLMKEVAESGHTIIASTHNPVVLNSLKANQVTLLSFDGGNMAHSHLVAEIKEARDVLDRGRINFGDLLQNDFQS